MHSIFHHVWHTIITDRNICCSSQPMSRPKKITKYKEQKLSLGENWVVFASVHLHIGIYNSRTCAKTGEIRIESTVETTVARTECSVHQTIWWSEHLMNIVRNIRSYSCERERERKNDITSIRTPNATPLALSYRRKKKERTPKYLDINPLRCASIVFIFKKMRKREKKTLLKYQAICLYVYSKWPENECRRSLSPLCFEWKVQMYRSSKQTKSYWIGIHSAMPLPPLHQSISSVFAPQISH